MEEKAGMNWIYCRERNPSENGDYLVTYIDDVYDECFTSIGYYGREQWWEDYDGCKHQYDKLDVFAWMPIPKPAVRK